jgi:hypothetical protein
VAGWLVINRCTKGVFSCTEQGDELFSILEGKVRLTDVASGMSVGPDLKTHFPFLLGFPRSAPPPPPPRARARGRPLSACTTGSVVPIRALPATLDASSSPPHTTDGWFAIWHRPPTAVLMLERQLNLV